MRKRFVRRALFQKATQRLPAIASFPTHNQQILINPSSKILEHRAIVVFISTRRIVVIPLRRLLTVDLIPPMRLHPVFVPDSLALVMPLQTAHVSLRVFPQRENELRIRKSAIEFFVEQKPGPVFERLMLLGHAENVVDLISLHFECEVHVESLVLESEAPEAVAERRRSGLRKTDADHLSGPHWPQFKPATANPIIDLGRNHE